VQGNILSRIYNCKSINDSYNFIYLALNMIDVWLPGEMFVN